MRRCEDAPCCGHAPGECGETYTTSEQMLADPARFHVGCDHETGYCEYEEMD